MSNYFKILALAVSAWLSQQGSISVDGYTITASNNGAPVKFTLAMAFATLEEFYLSGMAEGQFQVGSTLIVVAKNK